MDKFQVANLPRTQNNQLFGRESELSMLNDAWSNSETNIVLIKAMGGIGKTALLTAFADDDNAHKEAEAIYTWSFYLQSTTEAKQVSADQFFDNALTFFGYQGGPIFSAEDKGTKLAELVNQQRSLLILNGVETLQYPVGKMNGSIKDKALEAFFQNLSIDNQGLCLITSQQDVLELADKKTVLSHDLQPLNAIAGIELLRSFGIQGEESDLEKSVAEVEGNALALNLLASYIKTVFDGDINQRNKILTSNTEQQNSHPATKIMAAYETHLEDTTSLSMLYVMGLFDGATSIDAMQYLRGFNIPQLTDTFLDEQTWSNAFIEMREQHLIYASNRNDVDMLDTHPLIREYFAQSLEKNHPEAGKKAHGYLFMYYKSLPDMEQPDTLEGMQGLFSAIAHGCAAGNHQEALVHVFYPRMQREGRTNYLTNVLGAYGANLTAASHFFTNHWDTPTTALIPPTKLLLLNWVTSSLQALGRLEEVTEPMVATIDIFLEQGNWKQSSINLNGLSELQLELGNIEAALSSAQQSMELAFKSGADVRRVDSRVVLANIQHQVGKLEVSQLLFKEAEDLQKKFKIGFSLLDSHAGFYYCNVLLAQGNWQAANKRAEQWAEWRQQDTPVLDQAFEYLISGRANLMAWIEASTDKQADNNNLESMVFSSEHEFVSTDASQAAKQGLNQAVESLRLAEESNYLAQGLLARAHYHRFSLSFDESQDVKTHALADLQEAHALAQENRARLQLCDYHLESARLALTLSEDILGKTVGEHLQAAKQLIKETGYECRLPEVKSLEAML